MRRITAILVIACTIAGCRTPTFESKDEIEGRLQEFGITPRQLYVYPWGDTHLELSLSNLTDISALRGMKLSSLAIHRNPRLENLTALRGMPLKTLWIDETTVSDLTPLSGMPLQKLFMINTRVEDIRPLQGMPLNILFMFSSPVKDLSPLQGMPLTMLSFTPEHVTNGIDIVRSMKTINFISTGGAGSKLPAAEFWRQFDASRQSEGTKPDK